MGVIMKKNQFTVLVLEDVLDNDKGVTVRGVTFDCLYNVVIYKTGERSSDIEIDSHEHGPMSIVYETGTIPVDMEQFKLTQRSFYNEVLAAMEAYAIKKANNMPDYKWSVKEYAE